MKNMAFESALFCTALNGSFPLSTNPQAVAGSGECASQSCWPSNIDCEASSAGSLLHGVLSTCYESAGLWEATPTSLYHQPQLGAIYQNDVFV